MSWILMSNSHTSEVEITLQNLLERKQYQQVQLWCEKWAALYWEWHEQQTPMPVWNSERLWSAFILTGVKVMLSDCVKDQNPKAAGWLEKYWIHLDADILVTKDTAERSALACHHNLWDLMLVVSCGLEVSETVITWQRNPKETEEVMTLGSSKDVSNSGVPMESEDGIQAQFKVCHCFI